MVTYRTGQETGYGDPGNAVVRPTSRTGDDAAGYPISTLVVVTASDDRSITRYASWLADRYEIQVIGREETISTRPETEIVVVDSQTLAIAEERDHGTVNPRRRGCWVLATATVESCDALIDEYIIEPASREGLLGRVETALRMATYDGTIAELVSLTIQRRRLQTYSDTGRVDYGSDISSLSTRIDELHHRIDDELSDVESQYAALVGRRHRPSTRQDTGDERT
jgi:hypothetical protein